MVNHRTGPPLWRSGKYSGGSNEILQDQRPRDRLLLNPCRKSGVTTWRPTSQMQNGLIRTLSGSLTGKTKRKNERGWTETICPQRKFLYGLHPLVDEMTTPWRRMWPKRGRLDNNIQCMHEPQGIFHSISQRDDGTWNLWKHNVGFKEEAWLHEIHFVFLPHGERVLIF